jgi:hypothetical protein
METAFEKEDCKVFLNDSKIQYNGFNVFGAYLIGLSLTKLDYNKIIPCFKKKQLFVLIQRFLISFDCFLISARRFLDSIKLISVFH